MSDAVIKESFENIAAAMKADYGYAWAWHCNIAMASVDEGMERAAANRAAARFMHTCFGVDTSKEPAPIGVVNGESCN